MPWGDEVSAPFIKFKSFYELKTENKDLKNATAAAAQLAAVSGRGERRSHRRLGGAFGDGHEHHPLADIVPGDSRCLAIGMRCVPCNMQHILRGYTRSEIFLNSSGPVTFSCRVE